MEPAEFAINPNFKARRVFVGQTQTPVIILDDFLLNLETIKEYACTQTEMGEDNSSYYPGIRANLPLDYAKNTVAAVYRQLYNVFDIPKHLQVQAVNTVFSLITKTPDELALHQQRPHFDTPEPHHYAILHYLNDAPHGDTGFFRHKRTGLERISQSNMDGYLTLLGDTITKENVGDGFIKGSTDEFELIYQVPYQPNRLVIYPGNLLHSVLVDELTDIDPNPKSGRLTANIFIDYT